MKWNDLTTTSDLFLVEREFVSRRHQRGHWNQRSFHGILQTSWWLWDNWQNKLQQHQWLVSGGSRKQQYWVLKQNIEWKNDNVSQRPS